MVLALQDSNPKLRSGRVRSAQRLAAPHNVEKIKLVSGRNAAAEKRHQRPAQRMRTSGRENHLPTGKADRDVSEAEQPIREHVSPS